MDKGEGISTIKVEVEELEGCNRLLKVQVPAEEVKDNLEKSFSRLKKTVFVHGFRKGKAPLQILRLYYGKQVKEEVKERLVEEAYQKALEERGLRAVSPPQIEDVQFEEDKPLNFKAKVEVIPPVKLGSYKGVKVEKEPVEITEKDVEEALKMQQEEHAEIIPVKDRPCKKGDQVVIDYKVFVEGKPVSRTFGSEFLLGSGALPPEMEKGIEGLKIGDTKKIKVLYPEEKKEVEYEVVLKEIKERRLIVLSDEFARQISSFSSLKELRDNIRRELEQLARWREEFKVREQLLDQIISDSEIELPESLVNKQAEFLKLVDKERRRMVLPSEDEYRDKAIRMLKRELIIREVARRESIKVSEKEIREREKELVTSGKYRSLDEIPEGEKRDLEEDLLEEKVWKFLLENAQIKEKKKPLILKPEEVRTLLPGSSSPAIPRRKKIITP